MSTSPKTKVAVIGSGNIGTDLMIKVIRLSRVLEMAAMVGIDPASDGLARASRLGVPTTAAGVQGLMGLPGFADIDIVFDATSAKAHKANAAALAGSGVRFIDLTPAAIGPYVVPAVDLDEHLGAGNVNMVTCGGQATIPVVAAVSKVTPVRYAEIVASIASRSAGPGTRANIDEFTETTCSRCRTRPTTWCGRCRTGRCGWTGRRSPSATPGCIRVSCGTPSTRHASTTSTYATSSSRRAAAAW
jgi:acetaldehyde dehydrogenase